MKASAILLPAVAGTAVAGLLPSPPSLSVCVCAIIDVSISGAVVVLRNSVDKSYLGTRFDVAVEAAINTFKVQVGCATVTLPPPPPPPEPRDCADLGKALDLAQAALNTALSIVLPGFDSSAVCLSGVEKGIQVFKKSLGCKETVN